ncbi:SpoIIE family protein phosphatase [soil metagenome]
MAVPMAHGDEPFDRLARLAAMLLEAPLAFVTFVEAERSWYRSSVGLPPGADRFGAVGESFCKYVIGTGRPLVVGDTRADPRTCANPAIETMGVAAWAGFPLLAPDGSVLGSFCVVDTSVRTWTERDAQTLETLSEAATGEVKLRAALAAAQEARRLAEVTLSEAAELTERLLESGEQSARLARTLQQSLLPPHLPDVPGLEVAARYEPAASGGEVVGDFYDVFEANRSAWCVVMGDVCGKGPEAASLTALARYTLRAASLRTSSPARTLGRLNEALLHQRPDEEAFVTVAMASIRRRRGQVLVSVASAGHLPPLLRRGDGSIDETCRPGLPLGLFDQQSPVDACHELQPGDSLVFSTDGIPAARSGGEEFGAERLAATLATAPTGDAAALVDRVANEVAEFRDGLPRDDTAVLALHVPPLPDGRP